MSRPVTTVALPSATTTRSALLGPVLLAVVAVASLALGLLAFRVDRPTWGWLLCAVGVAVGALAADQLYAAGGRTGRLRLRTTETGLVVLGSPWSRAVDVVAAVVFVVALVASLLASVDAGAEPGGSGLATAGPVVVLALLAALAFYRVLGVLATRRRTSRLRLHSEGVEASGADGRATFSWDALTGVQAGPGPNVLVLLGHAGTDVPLPAVELRSDPQLVARLLEHYRTHPRDRAELVDERALSRVREDRLAAEA